MKAESGQGTQLRFASVAGLHRAPRHLPALSSEELALRTVSILENYAPARESPFIRNSNVTLHFKSSRLPPLPVQYRRISPLVRVYEQEQAMCHTCRRDPKQRSVAPMRKRCAAGASATALCKSVVFSSKCTTPDLRVSGRPLQH